MNKTKKLLILCLAIVLCTCCVVPSFSWYDHNSKNSESVNAIEYTRNTLPVYGYLDEDSLSMTTYKGTLASDGEVSYDEETVITDITAEKSADGASYNTTCYKSVIKNTSDKDVHVGLYLETAEFGSGEDSICFGTSDPIWRRITSASMNTQIEAKKTSTGTMRVYYQKSVWTEDKFYVVAYSNDYNHTLYPMTICPSDTTLYYADIPSTSKYFFVTCEEDVEPSRSYRRTNEISVSGNSLSPTACKYVYLQEGEMVADSTNSLKKYMKAFLDNVSGTNIANFVESLYLSTETLNDANKGSVALTKGTDYIGSSISFSSNNEDIAVVDADGNVTGKAEGTAIITTTVTGAKGDKSVVQTTVNVQNPSQTVPLVQNILVPKKGEASVCWYIDNKTINTLTDIKLMLTL
ncbi:MAG: Ig-like domain-containing protein [Ruminococcus sp.]